LKDGFSRRAARAAVALALLAPALLGSLCEGDGSGASPRIVQSGVDPRCAPIAGAFPSGFALLPGVASLGVVMQFSPAKLLTFRLDTAPPERVGDEPVPGLPADSDGDGFDDADFYRALGLCPFFNPSCITYPTPGALEAVYDDLVLLSTSGYEEVMFLEPFSGEPVWVTVANPPAGGGHRPADHPFLPPAGSEAPRTAIATKVCIYPPSPVDSLGDAIAPEPLCDAGRPGYLTKFTAAATRAGQRLFVATSNLKAPSVARFQPGSVLVFDFEENRGTIRISPRAAGGVLFTTAFNPTGLTPYRTRAGRDLVLVSLTGAIDAGGALATDGGIDVIDVASLRVVAHIPLGLSGTGFGRIAIEPGGRVGLLGAESARQIYAVDLRVLEDPALYGAGGAPIWLDGSTAGFADARIHWADAPLRLPDRPDGPDPRICPPRTNVALNAVGDLAYVTDWCDGSLVVIDVDVDVSASQPIGADAFTILSRSNLLAPKTPAHLGRLTSPGMIRTHPDTTPPPFGQPDTYFIANEPDAQLCAVRVEL
jgi:hypothetical protein